MMNIVIGSGNRRVVYTVPMGSTLTRHDKHEVAILIANVCELLKIE